MSRNQHKSGFGARRLQQPPHSPVPQAVLDDRDSPTSDVLAPAATHEVENQCVVFNDASILSDRVSQLDFQLDRCIKTPSHERSTLTLKEREKAFDRLSKENFNAKFKVYNLERRLEELSSDNVHAALQENAELKQDIRDLRLELKKYKIMILEMDSAMELLAKTSSEQCQAPPICMRQHGMSPQEKEDCTEAHSMAKRYQSENEHLRKFISELTSENARLRPGRIKKSSSIGCMRLGSSSSTDEENRHLEVVPGMERHRLRWLEARQTIDSSSSSNVSYGYAQYKAYVEVTGAYSAKKNERDPPKHEVDEMAQFLRDARDMLQHKTAECHKLHKQIELLQDHQRLATDGSDLLNVVTNLRHEKSTLEALVEKLRHELKDNSYRHQKQVAELGDELEEKEQDFVKLEAEVVKIVARAEEFEAQEKESNRLLNELESLEEMLTEKDQEIELYKEQLARATEEKTDIIAIVQKLTQLEDRIKRKDGRNKELEDELRMTFEKYSGDREKYEQDLDRLAHEFQTIEQTIRERDIRIASLEDHLEAQTETIQREKGHHRQEMKELKDKLRVLTNLLQEEERVQQGMRIHSEGYAFAEEAYEHDIAGIKEQVGHQMIEIEGKWKYRMEELEKRLRMAEEKFKKDQRLASEKLNEAVDVKRALHQKLEGISMKNRFLNELLDQYHKGFGEAMHRGQHQVSPAANQMLIKLNQELQRELEDRERELEREQERLDGLNEAFRTAVEEKGQLEELLGRRNSTITHLFERLESIQERKSVMENVLLRQATEDMTDMETCYWHQQSDSGLSSG